MKVKIHYGQGSIFLRVPEKNIVQTIEPWHDAPDIGNYGLIQQAISSKEADDFRSRISNRRLCILTEDGTRDAPLGDILGPLTDVLRYACEIKFIICTGTHDGETPENQLIKVEIQKALKPEGIENYRIHTHDCLEADFLNAGPTLRGTEVLYNALIKDADVFLVLSDMKTHYFAGYSNPVKNFVPGICGFSTAEQNHSLALDDNSTFGVHPWHRDKTKRANPLAQDQLEAMRMITNERPVYTFGVISTSRKIQWALLGPVEDVTREAFDRIDQRNTHSVSPVPRLIVSPGGFPNDTNLYITQRALELTKNAVTDGGEVLFLAKCRNGLGEKGTLENFYNRLRRPIDEILKSIETEYKLYSHKPYKFAQMIQRLRKIWMYSGISDELLKAAHLYPTHKPQNVVDGWLNEDPDAKIIIVDGANKIALYPIS